MALTNQFPLTTINASKHYELGFQPLNLAEITFGDGSILRLATENLDSTAGGQQYAGQDWLARLDKQNLAQISSVSSNGIVQSPSVTLTIIDPDSLIYSLWENQSTKGFKGAKMRIYLVLWDPGTSTFSSDFKVIFVGTCDPPVNIDDGSIEVKANSLLNMTRTYLPVTPVQTLCPWIFPAALADRMDGANNPNSQFYNCGYSPDVSGTNARGNYSSGTTPFIDCQKDWGSCIARMGDISLPTSSSSPSTPVQIQQDTSARYTARFGGIHYSPPLAWQGKNYISGSSAQGSNANNQDVFNDYYPMTWGTFFVNPIVIVIAGDPNITKMEVILGVGQLTSSGSTAGPVTAVLVNGALIPFNVSNNGWIWLTTGARSGNVDNTAIFTGQGDCYGGLATIQIVVPNSLAASNSIPNVQVLVEGAQIPVYTTPTAFSLANTVNPVWILLDILSLSNWQMSDINIQSFIDAATYAATSISYTDPSGGSSTHELFRAGLSLRSRDTAASVITLFMASFRAVLRTSQVDGTLELMIKQNLVGQQPAIVAGSNNPLPVAASSMGGITVSGGYLAFDFDESNVILGSLSFSYRPITDTPNQLNIQFQDEEANYVSDTLTVSNSDDISRIGGQLIQGSITAYGVMNFDQAGRTLRYLQADQMEGNPFGDTRGTMVAKWTTTSMAYHLRCGDIVALKYYKMGLAKQAFRVTAITPAQNYETMEIVATWHSDLWFDPAFGQGAVSQIPIVTPATYVQGPPSDTTQLFTINGV